MNDIHEFLDWLLVYGPLITLVCITGAAVTIEMYYRLKEKRRRKRGLP